MTSLPGQQLGAGIFDNLMIVFCNVWGTKVFDLFISPVGKVTRRTWQNQNILFYNDTNNNDGGPTDHGDVEHHNRNTPTEVKTFQDQHFHQGKYQGLGCEGKRSKVKVKSTRDNQSRHT